MCYPDVCGVETSCLAQLRKKRNLETGHVVLKEQLKFLNT